MIKNYLSLILVFYTFIFSYGQTTLAKEDIAIVGVNTDNEDFTFLLRTDITIGTEIYFSDNEVDVSGTALFDTNEGIVLFTAANDYSCGTVIGFISNSAEFTNVNGSLALANGGDELLAFQGYDNSDDSWTTFLHANVDEAITLPVGFTGLDIVDGSLDNREYSGTTNNPSWLDLNDISNYNEGNDFSTITLSTTNFTCTPPCTPTHTITSFNPLSGPVGTYVTINGSGFTPSTSVELNGTNTTIISQSSNELTLEVLSGTTTGLFTITEAGCPISSSSDFNIIENTGTCNSSSITDIIISEVYDSDTGNNWYLELYNPTATNIDLDAIGTDYAVERYANIGGATPSRTIDLTGTILANSAFTINLGNTADSCTFTADLTVSGAGINENDEITLLKNGTIVDVVEAPNETGYSIIRLNTANGPSNTFIPGDWSINGTETCTDIGSFSVPASNIPNITSQPNITNSCINYTFSISASPGSGGALTYQWKFNDGASNNWQDVIGTSFTPGTVSGEASNTLSINGFDLDGYQFYCEVTENGLCSNASNSVYVTNSTATWDGTAWDNGTGPDASIAAIIDDTYSTAVHGSFTACNLELNANLTVDNGDFIEVINDVTINAGRLTTETTGSFVQRGNNFTVGGTGEALVNKSTTPNTQEDYTYWSSPVSNITIAQGLTDANLDRRYTYNANNYLDTDGDNIDDDGNDWELVGNTDLMDAGKGYISMHGLFIFPLGTPYTYIFEGDYNTGDISQAVPYNPANTLNHWNLLGNPYPSAIDALAFFTANSSVVASELFMWSQVSPPDGANPGNEVLNFNQNDYITINTMGTSGNGTTPAPQSRVPSGQSFFISSSSAGTVSFTNAMRVSGANVNDDFYRTSQENIYSDIERLWVNLSSEIGIYSQVCIAYADNATDSYDGKGIDTERNYAGNAGLLYSMDNTNGGFYVIQGKSKSSLNEDEIINIGFASYISTTEEYSISLPNFEGEYLQNNPIYIRDNDLGIVHDLKSSAYVFTSGGGDFSNRFDIIFADSALSQSDNQILVNEFIISEKQDNLIEFSLSNQTLAFDRIEIYDVKGRRVFDFNGTSHLETFDFSSFESSVFIAKAHISNGQVITAKGIKRN